MYPGYTFSGRWMGHAKLYIKDIAAIDFEGVKCDAAMFCILIPSRAGRDLHLRHVQPHRRKNVVL